MRKYVILSLAIALSALLASCGADQAMKKGDKFYAIGEYYDAATQYRKAYSQTASKERALKGQRAMKLAECYRRINFTNKAITAYNNAVRYKQDDSLTHFHLGRLYMQNGNYKEAAKHYYAIAAANQLHAYHQHAAAALQRLGKKSWWPFW
jgi:tetratricopeptide (TPR) repeat protein